MVRKCNYILRDVEDAIPYGLNHETFFLQDVCTSQARRDVEDAIPYGLNHEIYFYSMSAPRKLGGMSRTPFPTV